MRGSFRVDLLLGSANDGRLISVVCAHLAHGDEWYSSADDYHSLFAEADTRAWLYGVGDYNLDFRASHQSRDDVAKLRYLKDAALGFQLHLGLTITGELVSWRPQGLQALVNRPRLLDAGFVHRRSKASMSIDWADAPGDHAFVHLLISGVSFASRTLQRRSVWRCTDDEGFHRDAASKCPLNFEDSQHFTSWMQDVMGPWTEARSSKERRKCWESARVKDLRTKVSVSN